MFPHLYYILNRFGCAISLSESPYMYKKRFNLRRRAPMGGILEPAPAGSAPRRNNGAAESTILAVARKNKRRRCAAAMHTVAKGDAMPHLSRIGIGGRRLFGDPRSSHQTRDAAASRRRPTRSRRAKYRRPPLQGGNLSRRRRDAPIRNRRLSAALGEPARYYDAFPLSGW